MKETFRVYLSNNEIGMITFERFSCKTLKTVIKNMRILLNNELYRTAVGKIETIEYFKVDYKGTLELLKIETL